MRILITSFFAIVMMSACSGKKGPGELLVQANDVHLQAVKTYDEVHELYGSLKKTALERQDSLAVVRLDSIHEVLHHWKDGLYEVPGFEHDHDHGHEGHSHDHEHKAVPNMTDQSMLDYQLNAKEAIDEILAFLNDTF